MKINAKQILKVCITLIMMLFVLFPFYIAVATAFKTPLETAQSVLAWPSRLRFENFVTAMKVSNFARAMLNSVITTFPGVVLIVLLASMNGYTIARNYHIRLFKGLEKMYLSALMLPFQILMIPIYKIFKTLNLMNSLVGDMCILVGTSIAYSTFLYIGFVKSVPRELEEAAKIDGSGPYRTFMLIVFPLLKPITATIAALHVMWLWNDFNIAITLLQKESVRTLTVKQFYFFGQYNINYNDAFAAAILSMLPILVFFIFAQKYLVSGIAAGAVKG